MSSIEVAPAGQSIEINGHVFGLRVLHAQRGGVATISYDEGAAEPVHVLGDKYPPQRPGYWTRIKLTADATTELRVEVLRDDAEKFGALGELPWAAGSSALIPATAIPLAGVTSGNLSADVAQVVQLAVRGVAFTAGAAPKLAAFVDMLDSAGNVLLSLPMGTTNALDGAAPSGVLQIGAGLQGQSFANAQIYGFKPTQLVRARLVVSGGPATIAGFYELRCW